MNRNYEHLGDVSLTVPTLQRLASVIAPLVAAESDEFMKTELSNFVNRLEAIIDKAAPAEEDWLQI